MLKIKESCIEWIGSVPINWEINRFRYVYSIKKAKLPGVLYDENDGTMEPYLTMEYIRDKENVVPQYAKDGIHCNKQDILLLWDGSNAGEIIYDHPVGYASSTVAILSKLINIDENYAKFYLKFLEEKLRENTNGMGIPHVDGNFLKNLVFLIPTKGEQSKISQYLNSKIDMIDKIIKKINSQIIIINEYKKAIINEAVTKGLSSYVNAQEIRIGRLVDLRQGLAINAQTNYLISEEETSLALLRIADMNSGMKEVFMKEKTPKQYIANKEDIIYTRTGQIGLVFRNQEGVVHNNCFRVIPKDEKQLSKRYLYWVLKSDKFYQYANMLAVGSAQSDLAHSSFKQISVTLFNLKEQELIANYLDKKCKEIDDLIKNKQEQIEKMEQYKKSLIYEYVTGKKRVKGAEELYG